MVYFASVWHVEYLRGSLLQGEITLNFGVKWNASDGENVNQIILL